MDHEQVISISDYIPNFPLCGDKNDEIAIENLKVHGNYRIERRIGYGSFSNVYLATRQFNKEGGGRLSPYAIKVVDENKISSSEILAGMVLNHKNINQLVDWFRIENYYYLVFEFIDGPDLQLFLDRKGRIEESFFKRIFSQILSAIVYCHQCGVIHRDIKMENVVTFGPDGSHIKLVDFGFCFFTVCPPEITKPIYIRKKDDDNKYYGTPVYHKDELNTKNKLVGTEDYCAPELILGAIEDDKDLPPTDIYSLGVIFYICTVGQFPRGVEFSNFLIDSREGYIDHTGRKDTRELFKNRDFCNKLISVAALPFDRYEKYNNTKLSEKAKDLIRKLLHPIPEKRITLNQILNHPWLN